MPREERNKIINNIKATMAVENQKLNDSDIQLLEGFADELKKENYLHKNRSNLVKFMILY